MFKCEIKNLQLIRRVGKAFFPQPGIGHAFISVSQVDVRIVVGVERKTLDAWQHLFIHAQQVTGFAGSGHAQDSKFLFVQRFYLINQRIMPKRLCLMVLGAFGRKAYR